MAIAQSQLGAGGTGAHGRGKGTMAQQVRAMAGMQVVVVTGGAANAVLPLDIDADDKLVSVINFSGGVPADVTANASVVTGKATGTITLGSAGTAGDTVTVAGQTYTLVAATTKLEPHENAKVKVGTTAAATAANLAAAINLREGNRSAKLYATVNAAVVTLTAAQSGTAGNALTLAETGNSITVSGATLTGGTATGGLKVSVATSVLQVFYFKNA